MVIFGRIQQLLYAAGVIPDNMWGSVPGRSTQEASFLYDMYLDDEDLEAFMASVDVKGAFPNTPHRLIEEVWRQLGLPYGPHARIDRTRDTRVAEPWLPAPEDGRPGEGQRLTPGARHNGGRHPPRGRPSTTPTASNAGPQGRTLGGRCWVHTPVSTAPGTHGSRNLGSPLQRTGGRGRDSA